MTNYQVRLTDNILGLTLYVDAATQKAAEALAMEQAIIPGMRVDSVIALTAQGAPVQTDPMQTESVTEYRVVIGVNGQELPIQLLAGSKAAAERAAMELYGGDFPGAKVVISGPVDRTPEPKAVLQHMPGEFTPHATAPVPAYPSIGRIVHLKANDGKPVAAIITAVHKDAGVSLTAFVPDHLPGYVSGVIPFSEKPKKGHWNWPPRV